jgi:RNA polymerase sigma-70 factor (ECF subfamily)
VSQSRSTDRRARHEAATGSLRTPWFTQTTDDALDAEAAVSALASLPCDDREVVVLRLWSGLLFGEIAELTGVSTSTAHRRYENGLRLLRDNWSIPCPNNQTRL